MSLDAYGWRKRVRTTRPLFIHVTTRREQCECSVIVEEGKLVVKNAETGNVVRCGSCAGGKMIG